jgi:hypothetical protein
VQRLGGHQPTVGVSVWLSAIDRWRIRDMVCVLAGGYYGADFWWREFRRRSSGTFLIAVG